MKIAKKDKNKRKSSVSPPSRKKSSYPTGKLTNWWTRRTMSTTRRRMRSKGANLPTPSSLNMTYPKISSSAPKAKDQESFSWRLKNLDIWNKKHRNHRSYIFFIYIWTPTLPVNTIFLKTILFISRSFKLTCSLNHSLFHFGYQT